MKQFAVACFVTGLVLLLTAFVIALAGWAKLAGETGIMQAILAVLGVIALSLAVSGILSKGKDRWRSFTMLAVLLVIFCVLAFFSVGLIAGPFVLAFLGFSVWKLVNRKKVCQAC